MGPCPNCKRHVSLSERACPFCGQEFGMTRRDLVGIAAAAATLAIAPVADAAREPWHQAVEYGKPRPEPEPVGRTPADLIYSSWMADAGIFNPANAWASHKPGTIVTYVSANAPKPARLSATISLEKVADAAISLKITPVSKKTEERTFGRNSGITKDAKVVDESKETIEIDGVKYDCALKTYEMPGRTFKIWSHKDAPSGVVKVVCGDETTTLVKAKETIKTKAGDFECSAWETVAGTTSTKTWRCEKAPGLAVRVIEAVKGAETSITVELSSITEGK